MNVKFHNNPSDNCQDISVKTPNVKWLNFPSEKYKHVGLTNESWHQKVTEFIAFIKKGEKYLKKMENFSARLLLREMVLHENNFLPKF